MIQVLIVPLPDTQAEVQNVINSNVGEGTLLSTSIINGPYEGFAGPMLMIVFN